jgi:NAD(P)-dependent dehydrogenase (short-subunit alcohol dehydrogenase family)
MTKTFAENGAAKVYIVGRRKQQLEEAAKHSPNIVPIIGDVTSKESLMKVAEQVKQETGRMPLGKTSKVHGSKRLSPSRPSYLTIFGRNEPKGPLHI